MTSEHRATFLREFLREPFTVGAVAPSGMPLAGLITSPVPRTGNPVVVELGPGTGGSPAAGTTFAYTLARFAPPARRLRRHLGTRFDEVVAGRTVWANLPPAFVYFCRRPRVPAQPHALIPA